MTAGSALARGRTAAARIMVDTCTITDPATEVRGALNTSTGTYAVATPATAVYTGACRVRLMSPGNGQTIEAGDADLAAALPSVQIPVSGSESVRVGHMVEITAAAYDTDLVGRKFRVESISHYTHAVKRTLLCKEML